MRFKASGAILPLTNGTRCTVSMDKFVITGRQPLGGAIKVSGAKNASLALMPATILAPGTARLSNTPELRDVVTMGRLLEVLGLRITRTEDTVSIDSSELRSFEAPYEHVKKMRASIYVLGPLVARYGMARVSLPGGCAWGPRPVNLHIQGMKKLGAEIDLEGGYIVAKAKRLKGARIAFDVSSVGATGNVLMAAVLAQGTTVIENAAQEPEIVALAEYLVSMGAKIDGIGSTRLVVEGVHALRPADVRTIPDRIEAGTFMVAAAMAGRPGTTITVESCDPTHLGAVLEKLDAAGAVLTVKKNSVDIEAPERIRPVSVVTGVYPAFPTDMQAQWMALMLLAGGTSVITDTVYFDRFTHVPELARLGGQIMVRENSATVVGAPRLTGAKVMSTDLRASASLILGGLAAEGVTEVLRVYHLDRGYERIEQKLNGIGAHIRRVSGEEF